MNEERTPLTNQQIGNLIEQGEQYIDMLRTNKERYKHLTPQRQAVAITGFIEQLELEMLRNDCQATINLVVDIAEKIKILEKMREEIWPSQEHSNTQA